MLELDRNSFASFLKTGVGIYFDIGLKYVLVARISCMYRTKIKKENNAQTYRLLKIIEEHVHGLNKNNNTSIGNMRTNYGI